MFGVFPHDRAHLAALFHLAVQQLQQAGMVEHRSGRAAQADGQEQAGHGLDVSRPPQHEGQAYRENHQQGQRDAVPHEWPRRY
jgi:hypothetical protein